MTAQEMVDVLVRDGYVGKNKQGRLIFLKKFYDEGGKVPDGALTSIAVKEQALPMSTGKVDWVEYYMNFIMEARVPARGQDNNGNSYDMNKYSEPGMKAFKAAITGGAKYEVLVRATFLYYQSQRRYKVAIGRYMDEGLWRSDYQALLQAAAENKVAEHIKTETKDEGQRSTGYRMR